MIGYIYTGAGRRHVGTRHLSYGLKVATYMIVTISDALWKIVHYMVSQQLLSCIRRSSRSSVSKDADTKLQIFTVLDLAYLSPRSVTASMLSTGERAVDGNVCSTKSRAVAMV